MGRPRTRGGSDARALAAGPLEPAGLRAVVDVLLSAGSVDEVGRLLDPAPGSSVARAVAALLRSRRLLFAGSLAAAESEAREGLEAYRRWAAGAAPAWADACLAQVLAEQGRLDEAATVLGDHAPAFSAATAAWFTARGRLDVLQGRAEEGVTVLLELGRGFEALDGTNPAVHAWRSEAALGLLALGERERAASLAEEELALARVWGAPAPLGRALRVAGICADEPARLREAVATLDPSGARLELAKALVYLGAALRRASRRADARAPPRRELEEATVSGAGPLVARAETELSATGARRRRQAFTGSRALTPSERRVAELAAGGASNRDIAAALFVTVKTVEVHLSNAYRKLGIASRDQLSRALPPR